MFRVMHRMTAVGLGLVTLAVVAGGVVSYWRGVPDGAIWIPMTADHKEVKGALVRGTVHVVYTVPTSQPAGNSKTEKHFGPFYTKQVTFGMVTASGAGAPFWSIAVLTVIYPAMALMAGPLKRRRRRKRNQCIHCGYRLEGLTERRCPECGKGF